MVTQVTQATRLLQVSLQEFTSTWVSMRSATSLQRISSAVTRLQSLTTSQLTSLTQELQRRLSGASQRITTTRVLTTLQRASSLLCTTLTMQSVVQVGARCTGQIRSWSSSSVTQRTSVSLTGELLAQQTTARRWFTGLSLTRLTTSVTMQTFMV